MGLYQMSDDALIRQCQDGDRNAFEALLKRHYDTIYRYAYRFCQDQANAQDVTQLVCMKLVKSLQTFRFDSSFSTWLYPIVVNSAKDFYKSPNQYNKREENIDDVVEGTQPDQSNQQDTNDRTIYAQQILQHINTLDEDLKETLLLVFGKGLNHRDAAQRLKVKESTVSWRIHEARKILKQTFNSASLNSHRQEVNNEQ